MSPFQLEMLRIGDFELGSHKFKLRLANVACYSSASSHQEYPHVAMAQVPKLRDGEGLLRSTRARQSIRGAFVVEPCSEEALIH